MIASPWFLEEANMQCAFPLLIGSPSVPYVSQSWHTTDTTSVVLEHLAVILNAYFPSMHSEKA
jgi:hypothetical protein